jgi:hypothetical protein
VCPSWSLNGARNAFVGGPGALAVDGRAGPERRTILRGSRMVGGLDWQRR